MSASLKMTKYLLCAWLWMLGAVKGEQRAQCSLGSIPKENKEFMNYDCVIGLRCYYRGYSESISSNFQIFL